MRRRRFGVLAHVSSLPSGHGIGDLGASSFEWLEWLSSAGVSLWQVLPVGPTGFGDSPYSALSSFAGNPLLIELDSLVETGLLEAAEIEAEPSPRAARVDFAAVRQRKEALLRRAAARLAATTPVRKAIETFRHQPEQGAWLEDWALYAALKHSLAERSWTDWPAELRQRDEAALAAARQELAEEIDYRIFEQFLFFEQWAQLRRRAAASGVELLGDLPFYPALDSADVWTHQDLFELDDSGQPLRVAGVPPDAFAAAGQRWGNPVYRWRRLADDGYAWWVERLAANLGRFDHLRLDHFRGYAAYWAVPADAATATSGCWVAGPGGRPFHAARERLGALPLIAEDLGLITPAVERLRRRLGFPGTRVLQFAFDDRESTHLPHRLGTDVVAYTATHDNPPTRAWLRGLGADERRRVLDLTGGSAKTIHWDLLRSAAVSAAADVVAPVQDLLGLGASARLNHPGKPSGQWRWRLGSPPDADLAERIRGLVAISGRLPGGPTEASTETEDAADG